MPASGLREAHFHALRANLGSAGNSRSSSPDPCHVSKEDWLKHQERLIKEVDPSFDSSLMCPVGLSAPSSSTTSTHQRNGSPVPSLSTLGGYSGPGSVGQPAFALGGGHDGSARFESPSRFHHEVMPKHIPIFNRGLGATQSGELSTSFNERPTTSIPPPTRRRSMDASQPVVNFHEVEKASQEMDLEGVFIESISIIPVDDDKATHSGQVLFALVSSDGRDPMAAARSRQP